MGEFRGEKGVGVKGKSGRKTASVEFFCRTEANRFKPKFWNMLNEWIDSEDDNKIKTALIEFNKVQVKLIPTDITSGGKELKNLTKEDVVREIGNLRKIN